MQSIQKPIQQIRLISRWKCSSNGKQQMLLLPPWNQNCSTKHCCRFSVVTKPLVTQFTNSKQDSKISSSEKPKSSIRNDINTGVPSSSVLATEITLDELRELAMKPCTPLSLADMYKYASSNVDSKNYGPQRLRNSQFLHRELPIRVAQRTVDLLTLPLGLNKTRQVQEIAHTYLQYLKRFKDMPCPQNEEEELKFTDMLRDIIQDRTSIPMAIAQGMATLKNEIQPDSNSSLGLGVDGSRSQSMDPQRLHEMEKALYRFFNARTGLRFLAEHHVLSCKQKKEEYRELRRRQSYMDNIPLSEDGDDREEEHRSKHPSRHHHVNQDDPGKDDNYLGCIQFDCNAALEAKRVAKQVMRHCKECYGVAPNIEIKDCTPKKYSKVKFTYAPHHLQYILAELLKNSCRATVQK